MAAKRETAQERWGKEFAHAREEAGLTQSALSKDSYVSPSLIGMWETGKRSPKLEDLARCEERLGTKGYLTRLLTEWASREVPHEWLDKWITVEEQAIQLLCFQTTVVPGLLQNEDYARTVLELNPWAQDVEEQVNVRLERQRILTDDGAPLFVAVMSEAVLRHPVGSAKIMYDQLMHIIELAKRPNAIIHVIPFELGAHAGFAGPFVIASIDGQDIAYVDNALRGGVVEQSEDVVALKRLWSMLMSAALPEKASIDFIVKVAQSWTVP